MKHYPGRRLREWWRTMFLGTDEMTSRELLVMFEELPDDSRSKKALTGDPWDINTHSLASIIDALGFIRDDLSKVLYESPIGYEAIKRPGRKSPRESAREQSMKTHDGIMGLLRGEITISDMGGPVDVDTRVNVRAV
jgi:hypothetical protein